MTQFAANGDKRVAGDYDKDGVTDIAVWRNNGYLILQSSNNQLKEVPVGLDGDIPIGGAVQ